jgi:type III pantothenate kinase
MAPMHLVLDIGSTETTAGLFRGDVLHGRWRLASDPRRTPDEAGLLLLQLLGTASVEAADLARVSVASVQPAVSLVMAQASEHYLGARAVSIEAGAPLPIHVDVDDPLGVGADRLVNAVAAHRLIGADVLIVDLGTATTYDCVTAEGAFIGGAIAPGLRTGAERLFERTARLPRVPLVEPDRVIGRNTRACLQSGIFWGAVDAVDGMVHRIRSEWARPDAVVVATGGLAPQVGPRCRTVQRVEPDLTLHGIRLAREHLDVRAGSGAPGGRAGAAVPLTP